MLTTLALVASLSLAPAQAGELEVKNVRATNGLLGTDRDNNKYLPGDQLWIAFELENLKVDENNVAHFSMALEVLDSKGKSQYKKADPQEQEIPLALGGGSAPGVANLDIGFSMKPDTYTVKITATDQRAKVSKTLERKFEVMPLEFGLVRLKVSYDPDGKVPAPRFGSPGQSFFIGFWAVGFGRGGDKKAPHVTVQLQVYDENNKPMLAKPFPGEFKEAQAELPAAQMGFWMPLNRPGKFKVVLSAEDKIGKKKAELSFPLVVMESK